VPAVPGVLFAYLPLASFAGEIREIAPIKIICFAFLAAEMLLRLLAVPWGLKDISGEGFSCEPFPAVVAFDIEPVCPLLKVMENSQSLFPGLILNYLLESGERLA